MTDSPLDRLAQHNPDLADRLHALGREGEQAARQVLAGDYIAALAAAQAHATVIESAIIGLVEAATRSRSATWSQIAQALGLRRKQTAHARYGRTVTDYQVFSPETATLAGNLAPSGSRPAVTEAAERLLRPAWLANDPAAGVRYIAGWSLLRTCMIDEERLAVQTTRVPTRAGRTVTLQLITPYAHFEGNDSSPHQAAAVLSALAGAADLPQRVAALQGRGRLSALGSASAVPMEYCVRIFYDSDTHNAQTPAERLLIGTPLWVRRFLAPVRSSSAR
ncbi:hypothetical protein GCM10010156_66000 [Planobispora rosea]|uniref:Uncharacterized protein n=1 Tax=Planobispora rosea TaxID=35762 RepID=A0A8J3WFB5_PLARO|nr:hypothetical protein [Planobispora rosea]GGS98680.1 hypothetical protein GCM10010156_66000 [Planobispora rosea]GIH87964.1 hypothetical protein Pro02_63720 [Planobispora rosea]